jgi:hypothetical protein
LDGDDRRPGADNPDCHTETKASGVKKAPSTAERCRLQFLLGFRGDVLD